MNTHQWTSDTVAKRFEEAVDTLNRLPQVDYLGYARYWPESLVKVRDCLDIPHQKPVPPSPDAIERLEQTLQWITWLEEEERKLVWMRAEGKRWKSIMHITHSGRTHLTWKWKTGLSKIAIILNFLSQQKVATKMCAQKKQKSV